MIVRVPEEGRPAPRPRSESRETIELRAIRARQPELAEAVDMHLELLELQRRIQGRVPVPTLDLSAETMARHQAEGRPLLPFDAIPLELSDLRLMVRQTADVLKRFGALDDLDGLRVQAIGRDMKLLTVAGEWYRSTTHRGAMAPAVLGPLRGPTGAEVQD